MNKRGQVTPFIIVGIVIVIIFLVVIFVYKPEFISPRLSEGQLDPVRNYVEDCMGDVLAEDLFLLKKNAGNYDIGRYNDHYGVNYLIYDDENYYHKNENIAGQINKNIKKKLLDECSLDFFREDYDIIADRDKIEVNTEIGDHAVISRVYYPIIISKGDLTLEISDFSASIESDFGLVNDVANLIITEELYNNGYSADDLEKSIYDEDYVIVVFENTISGEKLFNIGSLKERDNMYNFLIKK